MGRAIDLVCRVRLATIYHAGGIRAVIDRAHLLDADAWKLATTAYYGPVGILRRWKDAEGRPSVEARRRLPTLDRMMREAEARLVAKICAVPVEERP